MSESITKKQNKMNSNNQSNYEIINKSPKIIANNVVNNYYPPIISKSSNKDYSSIYYNS